MTRERVLHGVYFTAIVVLMLLVTQWVDDQLVVRFNVDRDSIWWAMWILFGLGAFGWLWGYFSSKLWHWSRRKDVSKDV